MCSDDLEQYSISIHPSYQTTNLSIFGLIKKKKKHFYSQSFISTSLHICESSWLCDTKSYISIRAAYFSDALWKRKQWYQVTNLSSKKNLRERDGERPLQNVNSSVLYFSKTFYPQKYTKIYIYECRCL